MFAMDVGLFFIEGVALWFPLVVCHSLLRI
jgi:hypothetical protein